MAGPFDDLIPSQPAPAPTTPGIIRGRPDPYKASNDIRANNADIRDERRLSILEQEAADRIAKEAKEQQEKAEQETRSKAAMRGQLAADLEKIDRLIADANDNGGFGETGTSGRFMRALPISGAGYSLGAELETFRSKNAFAGLSALADQDIKLTPVSNEEIRLAAASIANLDPNADHETFMRALRETRQYYANALARLQDEQQGQPAQQNQVAPGMQSPPAPNGNAPLPPPTQTRTGPVDSFVTSDDKRRAAELQRAFDNGASPEQMNALAAQLGVDPFQPAELARIMQARQQGMRVQIAPRPTGQRSAIENMVATVADSPVGAYTVGAANALTLGGLDEIAGLFGGEGAGERAQFAKDYLRENNQVPSLTGEVAGTALGALGLTRFAPGAAQVLATPGGQTAAGATYGFLDNNENRLLGAATGGVVGRYAPKVIDSALASAPAQRLGQFGNDMLNLLPQRQANQTAQREVAQNADVIQAAQAEGLTLRQPDVRPSLRDQYGGAEAGQKSGPIIQRAIADDTQQIADRVTQIAGQGTPREGYALGESVQAAVNNQKQAMRDEAGALFRRVGLQAPNFKAAPDAVARTVDEKIANIQAITPQGNESQVAFLNKIKSNFEQTGVSVESLQANRDLIRSQMKQDNLAFTAKEVELLDVIDQAAIDLENGLRNSGNTAALATLQRANEKWRAYSDFKKQVVRSIVGTNNAPVSPEQAATRLLAMVKKGGDSDKFAKVFAGLGDDEKADFRALVAEQLGSNNAGEFSLSFLANNLTSRKYNLKTLQEVFGPDGFRSLMNIQKVARAKVDATAGFNRSNTARAQNNAPAGIRDMILRAFGAGGGFTVGGVGGAVAGAAAPSLIENLGQKRAARMLLNSDFSKWLVNMPNARNPNAINAYFKKLDKIAPQGSVISADIILFKDLLRQNASPGQLAASEQQNDMGQIPPQ